ncbi:MAG: ribosomal L7Ae/L30e/S12e/Gadd45 family protein [Evtepia sp.]
MALDLTTAKKVVGAKQVARALRDHRARCVYFAQDADPRVTEPIELICSEQDVPTEFFPGMSELGTACGISVGSAVAAIID